MIETYKVTAYSEKYGYTSEEAVLKSDFDRAISLLKAGKEAFAYLHCAHMNAMPLENKNEGLELIKKTEQFLEECK